MKNHTEFLFLCGGVALMGVCAIAGSAAVGVLIDSNSLRAIASLAAGVGGAYLFNFFMEGGCKEKWASFVRSVREKIKYVA